MGDSTDRSGPCTIMLCGWRRRHPVHVELILSVRSCRLQGLGGLLKRLVGVRCAEPTVASRPQTTKVGLHARQGMNLSEKTPKHCKNMTQPGSRCFEAQGPSPTASKLRGMACLFEGWRENSNTRCDAAAVPLFRRRLPRICQRTRRNFQGEP